MNEDKKGQIWDEEQENTCGYCIFSGRIPSDDRVTCSRKTGIFEFNDTCKKFKFDILKKEVTRKRIPDFSKFSAENFEL